MPGRLRQDVADQAIIWRPILAGKVTLDAVESGMVPLERLMQLNGLLDMQQDIERREMERNQRTTR